MSAGVCAAVPAEQAGARPSRKGHVASTIRRTVPPRTIPIEPVSLVLYEDPLSPWCLVAERRVRAALEDVLGAFAPLRLEPFPLRPEPRAVSARERRSFASAARKAAREPEAAGITPDLWLSQDTPVSSLPALAALVAARLQGAAREAALREAMREAALVRGINVTRRDVLYELAQSAGLDVARFACALSAPATEKRVVDSFEEALGKGIDDAPALVIGDEWLVAGPRTPDEYRSVLRRYIASRLGLPPVRTVH
jgi:predicted DsbA family dithiol-disulfide isomerase